MPTCTVNGCFSTTGRRLPSDVKQREKWLESLNKVEGKYGPNSVICLKHFCESDFVPDSENIDSQGRKRKRRRLKPSVSSLTYLESSFLTQNLAKFCNLTLRNL